MSDNRLDEVSEVEREREAYRQKERRRSVMTSIGSSLALMALIVVTLKLSPGWPRVKESFFSAEYFAMAWPQVVEGLLLNIRVLGVALIGNQGVGRHALLRYLADASREPVLAAAQHDGLVAHIVEQRHVVLPTAS